MEFLKELLSNNAVGLLVAAALGLLGTLLGPGVVRRRRVALAVRHAFQLVNDIDAELGPADTKLDKPVAGLKAADDWMKANGWRALTAEEQALGKLEFQALHGEEKQAVKVAAEAALPS